MPNENFYLSFTEGAMSIYQENNKVTADFIKLYPANDINLQNKSNNKKSGSTTNTPSQNPTQHTSSGSGIFIAPKIIATNYHVIDGAEKIEILIKSGEDVNTYTAKVLCSDKTNDLALLSLDKSEFTNTPIDMSNFIDNITFIQRTKSIIENYNGEFDVSLIINSCVGLLFMAKEKYHSTISRAKSEKTLAKWGINISDIKFCGKYDHKRQQVIIQDKGFLQFAHISETPLRIAISKHYRKEHKETSSNYFYEISIFHQIGTKNQ